MPVVDSSTIEANERLARRMAREIWSEGDLSVIDELFAEDGIAHFGSQPEPLRGRAEMKAFVSMYLEAFPDLEVDLEDVIASEDAVVGRFVLRGTHEGELFGVEPTGSAVEFTGFDMFRFEDGQVVEEWNQSDIVGLLQQLGILPDPLIG